MRGSHHVVDMCVITGHGSPQGPWKPTLCAGRDHDRSTSALSTRRHGYASYVAASVTSASSWDREGVSEHIIR
jgi:hypothetical protein